MAIKVSIVGASGRMGTLARSVVEAEPNLTLHSTLGSMSSLEEAIGADVIFDVTRLEVSQQVVDFAVANSIAIVVGTSGWNQGLLGTLSSKMNAHSSVVVIPNFSVGSMLATRFAAEAAKYFDSIEIVEAHHAKKLDSPSGTAIRTAEMIAANRNGSTADSGDAARGQIVAGVPVHSLRLEGVSAKQDVYLGGNSELLTISHETTSVDSYAHGIKLAIEFATANTGLHVGLDSVIK